MERVFALSVLVLALLVSGCSRGEAAEDWRKTITVENGEVNVILYGPKHVEDQPSSLLPFIWRLEAAIPHKKDGWVVYIQTSTFTTGPGRMIEGIARLKQRNGYVWLNSETLGTKPVGCTYARSSKPVCEYTIGKAQYLTREQINQAVVEPTEVVFGDPSSAVSVVIPMNEMRALADALDETRAKMPGQTILPGK